MLERPQIKGAAMLSSAVFGAAGKQQKENFITETKDNTGRTEFIWGKIHLLFFQTGLVQVFVSKVLMKTAVD